MQTKQRITSTRNAFTDRGNSVGRSSDPGTAAAGMGGGSRQATSAGSTKSGRTDGGWGWAKGGLATMFSEKR